jgi:hypothetical protein
MVSRAMAEKANIDKKRPASDAPERDRQIAEADKRFNDGKLLKDQLRKLNRGR